MSELEAQLETITREFVGKLVATIRNASFADVAALSSRYTGERGSGNRTRVGRAAGKVEAPGPMETASPRTRQTAARRAELSDRVVKALRDAGGALGVRALSSALGVPPDSLAAPLRELRDKGLVQKHGDKRATTYSV